MAEFNHLTNAELREEIDKVKTTLDCSPVKPNAMVMQLMAAAMKKFREVNAEPLEGEDPVEHQALLEEFDAFTLKYKLVGALPELLKNIGCNNGSVDGNALMEKIMG